MTEGPHLLHRRCDPRRSGRVGHRAVGCFAGQRLTSLTDREREIATAVGSGASNAEVAASLFMSEATVKAHVSRLLTKLGATNRVHIAILVHDAQS